ncbi:hypothetical protein HUJ05_006074 [Dendroctonus ponderosae]|nr:hypothetical protein HUJ05_006074 [Dendroctonus ponderosae]
MAASREPKVFEDSNYRKKMYSPLKNDGFVPEKHSELFVTGIPQKSSIHDLLQFFEQIGEVFEIKLMTKPDGVQNRGFAYVTYMNKQLAKMALIKLKDKLFQNKTKLNLQLSVDNCRIFINGIPTNKSRYDVRNVLRYDYRIENIVDVITYRSYANPAHNRGFAFLEFRTHEEASYFRAKYWDKLYMFGKKMSVTWAIPLKEMDEHEASKMEGYCYETSARRRAVHNPIKNTGFRPERAAEIFVSNIPAKASILDLLCFFQQTGDLFQATLVMKYKSELNRGYAFITYLDKNGAQRALTELRNQPFMNPATLLTIKQSTNNRRLFIGGVPIEKSKDNIWQELLAAYRVQNIVDVITYRNHANPLYNRGFVFLEFRTHDEAAQFRDKFQDRLRLFGKKVLVDWSVPAAGQGQGQRQKPSAGVPEKACVKILFLRNLNVTEPPEDFTRFIYDLIDRSLVDKVYKFKDYAYIHLSTRYNAEKLFASLQGNH